MDLPTLVVAIKVVGMMQYSYKEMHIQDLLLAKDVMQCAVGNCIVAYHSWVP